MDPTKPGAAKTAAVDGGKDARETLGRSLEEQLGDYQREKLAEGRAPRHVGYTVEYFKKAAAFGRWATLTDVTEDSARAYLGSLTNHRGEVASPKYHNNVKGYLSAVMAWAVKRRRIDDNPIARIEDRLDLRGEQIRPFLPEEFEALLHFTRSRSNGELAALVYEFAAWTGLRRGELKALRKCDLHLDAAEPFLELQPYQYKKGRAKPRSEKIPLVNASLVDRVREHVGALTPAAKVFPIVPHPNQVHDDIARSTVVTPSGARRPVENPDALGRRLTMHSIRHMLGTNLAVAGVDVRRIQAILRHRDIRTTQRYIDAAQLPNAAALREVGRFFGDFRAA